MNVICSFSCGATSTVATLLAIQKYGRDSCNIIYIDTGSEHPDNSRYLRDCEEKIFHKKINILRSKKYSNLDDCILKTRMLNSPRGAACTRMLKRQVWQEFYKTIKPDVVILGYHSGEIDRAISYRHHYPKYNAEFPLIDKQYTHSECVAWINSRRIELPAMYKMGYRNNNCIGCVKGGMGYWNKIRRDFPETFAKRALQERVIGHSCIRGIFLDELSPERGLYNAEADLECDLLCQLIESEVQNG